MKISIILLISLLSFGFVIPIFAQENVEQTIEDQSAQATDEINELKAELEMETQDPSTKIVRFKLKLTSNIDSDRVKVTWSSSGPNSYADGQNYNFNGINASGELRIRSGQDYSIPVDIKIRGLGVNEVIGKVEIFLSEGTKIVTVRSNFGSNADGEILPLTEEYQQAKNLNNIKNILVIVVLVVLAIVIGFFALRKFLKWLDRDERQL